MRKLASLGISPMPWRVYDGESGNDGYFASVRDSEGLAVHYSDDTYTSAPFLEANARLIAAAPELYMALHEIVQKRYICSKCKFKAKGPDCKGCPGERYNKILSKASGEDVE